MKHTHLTTLCGISSHASGRHIALWGCARGLAVALSCLGGACSDSNNTSGANVSSIVSGEFLALSYNVAGLPEELSSSNPETNTPLIGPLLNGYDLVLTQEDWETPEPNTLAPLRVYHEILKAQSMHPYQSVSAPLPLGNNLERPSALVSDGLNRFSQFPFGPIVRQKWFGCDNNSGDCLALKGFSMARTALAPGVCVDIYNLHGEAGNGEGDQALKVANTRDLVAFITVFSAGRAMIIGGDFNMRLSRSHDAENLNFLTAQTGSSNACAALGIIDEEAIDKFFFRSSTTVTLTPTYCRFETDIFVTSDGGPLSDHDPLAVGFAWSGAPVEDAECP
ncbi:MAG: hypothetical protein OSA45_01135 [Halioglobus sp.]|nr:hypothetical protein [Halioglobus sp.]